MTRFQAKRTSSPPSSRGRRLAAFILVVALAGCATPAPRVATPAPQAPPVMRPQAPPPPPAEAQPPGPTVELLCDETARQIPFGGIGIPRFTKILDVALTPDRAWLLVSPTHLVELWRDPAETRYRAVTGKEDAAWGALDVDPLDGSLWIVSSVRLELIHVVPDGASRTLKIARLEGQGGFHDILVEESGIWVVPTCAEHALWKVDRKGKVLQQEIRRDDREPLTLRKSFTPEEGQGSVTGCVPVSLARDSTGRVAIYDGESRSFFYRREDKAWKPFLELPEAVRAELPSGGVRVDFPGTGGETWAPVSNYSGDAPGFFFAGDAPVFQPSVISVGKRFDRFIRYERPEPAGVSTIFERCRGVDVSAWEITGASDRSGYVAAFGGTLLLGTFPNPGQEAGAAVAVE